MNSYFQQLYQQDDDPWHVRHSWYEQRKRNLLLAALPAQRYHHVFEPACGNGELTAALARRADQVTASDFSPAAVELTKRRLRQTPDAGRVAVLCQRVPQEWPRDAAFDLIVISEMAYYLSPAELREVRQQCLNTLTMHGTLVLCHWRHSFADRVQSTGEVHACFEASPELYRIARHEEADFLLDVWSPSPRSVAQREGVIP